MENANGGGEGFESCAQLAKTTMVFNGDEDIHCSLVLLNLRPDLLSVPNNLDKIHLLYSEVCMIVLILSGKHIYRQEYLKMLLTLLCSSGEWKQDADCSLH